MNSETTNLTPLGVLDDEARYQIFIMRDGRYDGVFVTAVRTTGVYCRPSCPARQPKRENVVFYADCAAAEAAGFRPCKRCRPQEVHPQAELVERACRYLEAHLDETVTLEQLGAALHSSPFHLQRTFKRATGVSPRQYAAALRAQRLKAQLRTETSVTDAIYEAGYVNSSQVYADEPLGMTPRDYQRGGQAQTIRYALADSVLGRVLVAATERGLCAVQLGDEDAPLVAALRAEFPAAVLLPDAHGLAEWISQVMPLLAGCQPELDLPLDIQATAFQQQVWEALRGIPCGETRSYSQLARALGSPKAARAVARACATNRIAVVIPCHRVVREDGDLGGYRWGLARKASLLASERQKAALP